MTPIRILNGVHHESPCRSDLFDRNRKFVLLSRDRRLPFVKLTKGEYLDALEVAIAQDYNAEKKRITEAEQGNQKRIAAAMKYVDERRAKRIAVLETNKDKYKARLQETAEISTSSPDIMLENYPDAFEGNGGSTRGMTFKLSKAAASGGSAESFVSLRLRPGFGGRDGEAILEGRFPSTRGYFSETKWLAAPGFSDTAQNNHITVMVRKKGEMLQVFIDQSKIAEYERAIPDALLFDAISFDLQREAGPNDQMFISNIRITKD